MKNPIILAVENDAVHVDMLDDIFKDEPFDLRFVKVPEKFLADNTLRLEWVIQTYEECKPDMVLVDLAWNSDEGKILSDLINEKTPIRYWKEIERNKKSPQVFAFLDRLEEDQKSKAMPVIILTRYKQELSRILAEIFPHRQERIIVQKPQAERAKWRTAILPFVIKSLETKDFIKKAEMPFIGDIDHAGTIELYSRALQVAANTIDAPVVITGETGTGKTYLARAVHNVSHRKNGPFIDRNIASIPKDLLYSELYGHKKGAFTGAVEDKKGILEAAEAGTVFLDEIGDLPLSEQIHLLTALEENYVYRLGDNKKVEINVRIIFATNRNLNLMVAQGLFRKDLYYRIRVIPVSIAPLRDRQADILLLSRYFLKEYSGIAGKAGRSLTEPEILALKKHAFPGNVRQLRSLIMRAVLMNITVLESLEMEEDEIVVSDKPVNIDTAVDILWTLLRSGQEGLTGMLRLVEAGLVRAAVKNSNSNYEAAALLRLPDSTFETKKRKHSKSL